MPLTIHMAGNPNHSAQILSRVPDFVTRLRHYVPTAFPDQEIRYGRIEVEGRRISFYPKWKPDVRDTAWNLAHNEPYPNLWDLRHSVHWFDSKQRAVLLVGQQIQQSVWTLLHLTNSLSELG